MTSIEPQVLGATARDVARERRRAVRAAARALWAVLVELQRQQTWGRR